MKDQPSESMYMRLNRYWRIVMTGLCFLFFGCGGLLLSLVWFNLLRLLVRDSAKRRKIARLSISKCFDFFMRSARFVRVLDYQVHGQELLEQDRGCLLLANHPTLLDYVILGSVMPDLDCVVKAGLLKNPFLSGVVKAADYLINDEDPVEFINKCQARLNQGDVILIFPEGTRTRRYVPVKLQRGAANIALRTQCDLRLVKITCQPLVVTKETRWYQSPLQKPQFKIDVQKETIKMKDFFAENSDRMATPSVAARDLTDYLTNLFTQFKKDNFGSPPHGESCSRN